MDKPQAGPGAPLRAAVAGSTVHQKGIREIGSRPLTVVPIAYLLDTSSDWNSTHMGKAKGVAYLAETENGCLVLATATGPARADPWTFSTTGSSIETGFWNYSDSVLGQVCPVAGSPTKLLNDALGTFTTDVYKPVSLGDIWDGSLSEFDFSALDPKDVLTIRINMLVTTTSPNQEVDVNLVLGVGGFEYRINFVERAEKTAGPHRLDVTNTIYIGASPDDVNTKDNPGYFELVSDGDTVVDFRGLMISVNHNV